MKVLITGAQGFIGKNLIAELMNISEGKTKKYQFVKNLQIYKCDIDTSTAQLDEYCKDCEFVFHLAGINRPQNVEEFYSGNFGFTTTLLSNLKKHNNKSPILMSSSIQAAQDNDYGKSKKSGEDYLLQYGLENSIETYVFRLPNVFGKWCRPNYNSVVATFCHNIANDLPIQINDSNYEMTLVYIDDVVNSFINAVNSNVNKQSDFCLVPTTYTVKLGVIAELLNNFKNSRNSLNLPDLSNQFVKKLYSTFLTYLPQNSLSYKLNSHIDNRGSFTEIFHTLNNGQISVNISKPNIVKGQHWHHTKHEKFLVVSGIGVIRLRNIFNNEILEFFVSSDNLEVVEIPAGYTHNIENLGENDMVTIMWCNEIFDQNNPDTFYLEV